MKYLITVIIAYLLETGTVFSNNSGSLSSGDTIFAKISATSSNDTIIAYGKNPWFVILDVRTPAEYATKHLSEGVVLDFYSSTFATTLATLNKSKVYLLHCAGGSRSAQVYTTMQNLKFRRVYEMTGGINAWTSAGLPVVTSETPVADVLSDTIFAFKNVPINQIDSAEFTITNAANSILSFSNITGISGTDFTTNFDMGVTILGARDYSFNVYYKPSDLIADSTIFSIESNDGTINFYLSGIVNATDIKNEIQNKFSIYNDNINQKIGIELNDVSKTSIVSIYDLNGKIIFEKIQKLKKEIIDYSGWKSNIYLLRITDHISSKTYKLPLIH